MRFISQTYFNNILGGRTHGSPICYTQINQIIIIIHTHFSCCSPINYIEYERAKQRRARPSPSYTYNSTCPIFPRFTPEVQLTAATTTTSAARRRNKDSSKTLLYFSWLLSSSVCFCCWSRGDYNVIFQTVFSKSDNSNNFCYPWLNRTFCVYIS